MMILRVAADGSYIEADTEGIDYLLNGLTALRDSEPGSVVSSPSILNGEDAGVGPFRLVRLEDRDNAR